MIKVLSGRQMKEVDREAVESLQIPGILLMENAGRAVYEKIVELMDGESVLVICGKGNNGGDGFVVARHLVENGVQTTVVSLFREDSLSGAALVNHNILGKFAEIAYFDDIGLEEMKELISYSDVVVDAVFGTGLNSEVKGFYKDVIDAINEYAEGEIVAVDIPSGIHADTGKVLGCAVMADYTVTFHAPKTGLLSYPGSECSGEITIAPIGIPDLLNGGQEFNTYLITDSYAHSVLPLRPADGHKGTFGKVFNIAGSFNMPGAAYMCSMSSLLVGAGYSTLATPRSAVPSVAAKAHEIVYVPLAETEKGVISQAALDDALKESAKSDVIVIGPGLGTDEATAGFVTQFVRQVTDRGDKVLLDGDALNILAMQKEIILPLNSVITPHPKELARLMKVSVEEIQENRLDFAKMAAERLNTTVVLKGAGTIIAQPGGSAYINTTGNSGMATAGSGDVLAGMIAGFIAQGTEFKDATILGVYLHGLAGDIAVKDVNEYSLTAGKLMEYIPAAINSLLGGFNA